MEYTFLKKRRKRSNRQWLIRGGSGATLIGAGLSWAIHTGTEKSKGSATFNWLLQGTSALVVFMTGLSIFVDAAKYRKKK